MAEQIKNWYDRRDAWLYEQTKAGAWVQPPRDQYRDVMYILHLEAENDALRERLNRTVKDVAERIKMEFYYEFDELIPSIMADKIDEIVKEVLHD